MSNSQQPKAQAAMESRPKRSILASLQEELSINESNQLLENLLQCATFLAENLPRSAAFLNLRVSEQHEGEVDILPADMLSRGDISARNASSPLLVPAGTLYVRPAAPINSRFHGQSYGQVKEIFFQQLKLTPGTEAESTRGDTAGLCARVWDKLGIDMTQQNFLSDLFWKFSNSKLPVNAILKALCKVLNAHTVAPETKYNGIIARLQAKFDELNPAGRPEGSDIKYLSGPMIDALFGMVNTSGAKKIPPVIARMAERWEDGAESIERVAQDLRLLLNNCNGTAGEIDPDLMTDEA